jgi:hypothetical protein
MSESIAVVPGGRGIDPGHVQAHATSIDLQDALADPNVDRASLCAGGPAVAPVAQVALREAVFHGVVGDARFLAELELVGGVFLQTRREDACLSATIAGDADILADVARARGRLHAQRVYRVYIQALGSGALQAWLLVELAAAGILCLDSRVDVCRGIVEHSDVRQIREALLFVDLRADDLAGEAADAERRIGKDDAIGELRGFRRGASRQTDSANGFEGDGRANGGRASLQDIAAGSPLLIRLRCSCYMHHPTPPRTARC